MQTQGAPPTPPHASPSHGSLTPGSMLGKYKIEALLGRGGMGNVYAAEDPMIRRRVAIKLLAPEFARDAAFVDRLLTEAQAAGNLNHPNAVTVHSVEHVDDTYFIVMELVSGGSVEDYLARKGSPGWRAATRLIAEACKALAAAHGMGLIHRDIKPSNLLLTPDGHVKVADFGLAKLTAAAEPTNATQPGTILGTPSFMSPEQCRGDRIDARSDLYSLGCTYYMMLTGRQPFEAASSMQVMFAHCSAPIPDPRALAGDVPESCAQVLAKALAKHPADRYDSAKSMLADLRAILGGGTVTGAAPLPRATEIAASADVGLLEALAEGEVLDAPPYAAPARRPDKRVWGAAVAGGSLLVLILVGAIIWSGPSNPPSDPGTQVAQSPAPQRPAVGGGGGGSKLDPQPAAQADPPAPASSELSLASPPVVALPATVPSAPVAAVGKQVPVPVVDAVPSVAPNAAPSQPTAVAAAIPEPVPPASITPPAAAAPLPPPNVTNSIGLAMTLIAPGTFQMGDDTLPDAPRRAVTISRAYYMGVTEVTQGQFTKVMGRVGTNRPPPDELPAAPVSWEQAATFCRKLSDLPAERAAGRVYRLPTEAEWEHACRAGTETKFAFGDELGADHANFGKTIDLSAQPRPDDGRAGPQRPAPGERRARPPRPPVGQGPPNEQPPTDASPRPLEPAGAFPPNTWGLHDMHGSVWEWCADYYAPAGRPGEPEVDPTGPKAGKSRVARGGSWSSPAAMCMSAYRNGKVEFRPAEPTLGFRVVCDVRR